MLSIVVTWRERIELEQVLPALVATANAVDGDVTIVNFGGSKDMLEAQLGDDGPKVSMVKVDDQEYFKSRARRISARSIQRSLSSSSAIATSS